PPAVPGHLWGSGHLESADDSNTWELSLSDTAFPVAVTLIQQSTAGGFNVQVYDPAGEMIASATARSREALVSFRPTDTGTYSLVVHSRSGAGDYSLAVSAGSDLPVQEG